MKETFNVFLPIFTMKVNYPYVNTLQPVVKEKVIENIEVKETEEQPTEQNTNENEVTENKEVAIE
jgi:hypothetical protein